MPITVKIPGSKSITNRVLALAALSNKTITIQNAAVCEDSDYMIHGLKKLGKIIDQKNDLIQIYQDDFKTGTSPIEIYTGNAGTATRFLTAIATLTNNTVIIEGDERMCERPIKELTDALNNLGADINTTNQCPPVVIKGRRLTGKTIAINGNISSQYVSAILMITPFIDGITKIRIEQNLCSSPYVEMTLKLMERFKVEVMNYNFIQLKIDGNQTPNPPLVFPVEPDCSSASYIGAYCALNPEAEILLLGIFKNSIQGDIKFLEHLKTMGCKITENEKGTIIKGTKNLKSLGEVDMNTTPDLVMTFAVLAMFTEGKTKITNISNLKIKETDRLKALENEIRKLGIKVKTGDDYIEINGNPKSLNTTSIIEIETYNDHRIAMCFGILQNKFPNLKINNPKCVEKSYPTFWEDLTKIKE